MAKRAPSSIDLEVAQRIRLYRVQAGLSQTDLGDAIGVTFQQVQKYEKGVNRVGAGRLNQIAEALRVPLSVFFDATAERGPAPEHTSLLVRPHAARLLKAFTAIPDERIQLKVVQLVDALSRPKSERATDEG